MLQREKFDCLPTQGERWRYTTEAGDLFVVITGIHFFKLSNHFVDKSRWDNEAGAKNLCQQLGYINGTKYTAPGETEYILAGNRRCLVGEDTVFDCPLMSGRKDAEYCTHDLDQGVSCV